MNNVLVIGAGGAGCSFGEKIAQSTQQEMLVVNTCREAPNSDDASYQIFLDMDGQPRTLKVLSQLLEKERNTLDGVLKGKEKVLICAGLGGFTGTNSVLLLAAMLKNKGLSVTAAVTLPMGFESQERKELADQSLVQLKNLTDFVFVHDHAKSLTKPNNGAMSITDYFQQVAEQFVTKIFP